MLNQKAFAACALMLIAICATVSQPAQAAKPVPAPTYHTRRAFITYHELGEYNTYIITADGIRLPLNDYVSACACALVSMTRADDGYAVAVFSGGGLKP